MAFEFGSFSQYDDSVTIADPSIATAASVIMLPRYKGALYQAMGAPEMSINTQDFEIYNRTKNPRTGTVRTDWNISDTTGLGISEGLASGITIGQVLKVESELVVVKEVTARGASATISVWARGAGGTTAATHTATTAITSASYAAGDLDLKNVESVFESTGVYKNYMQLMFETVDWQKRGKDLKRKGMAGDMIDSYLIKEATLRMAENLAILPIEGSKQVGVDGGQPYMTDGVLAQLADNASGDRPTLSYNANGAFTEAKLLAAIEEAYEWGQPTDIWMNVANKQIFNGFNYAKTDLDVQTDKSDGVAGNTINWFEYENVLFRARIDNDLPNDTIPILTTSKCWKTWNTNDPLVRKEEPTLSSREDRESLQGAVGIGVDGVGYDHTYMYGITT